MLFLEEFKTTGLTNLPAQVRLSKAELMVGKAAAGAGKEAVRLEGELEQQKQETSHLHRQLKVGQPSLPCLPFIAGLVGLSYMNQLVIPSYTCKTLSSENAGRTVLTFVARSIHYCKFAQFWEKLHQAVSRDHRPEQSSRQNGALHFHMTVTESAFMSNSQTCLS